MKSRKLTYAIRLILASAPAVAAPISMAEQVENKASDTESLMLTEQSPSSSLGPIYTLTADDLRTINAVNVESILQQLPQVVSAEDRSSNNPGSGRATINLRGLGTRRTAVLIDGMPFVPSGIEGVTDLNSIPAGLIKRIDVTTGGASVAYGSGAVAGAVNIVLDENFQGSRLNVSHQLTERGDGALSSADLTLGTSLAGKGNIAVNIGLSERKAVFQGDREFSTFTQMDDDDANGNPALINGGSTGVPGTSIFSGALGDFSPDSLGIVFDPDGNVRPFETGEANDLFNYAPVQYLQVPQSRKHLTFVGNLELNDHVELYGRGLFSDTQTTSQLASIPIFQRASEFTLDDSPFLTPFSQQLLSDAFGNGVDSDGDGIDDTATAFLRTRLPQNRPRRFELSSVTTFVQLGLRGDLGRQYAYDLYVSQGRVDSQRTSAGAVSRQRFQQALLLDLAADETGGTCLQPDSDATNGMCTPINIFGEGNISQASSGFVSAGPEVTSNDSTRSIYGAKLSRRFAGLPAGEAQLTLGFEQREIDADRASQIVNGQADDFLSSNSLADFSGGFDSKAVYAQVYAPLFEQEEGRHRVDLQLGYRLTDYTTSDGVTDYDAALSWAPAEFAKVKVGFNRAHRAPTVLELFSPQNESFPGFNDPCRGAAQNPELAAVCLASGVPESLLVPAILPGQQVRTVSGGNPDLKEEHADTFSLGVEFSVPLGDRRNIRASANYFSVEGSQAIVPVAAGVSEIANRCYDVTRPADAPLSVFCNLINRGPDGSIEFFDLTDQNAGRFELSGLDLSAQAVAPAAGGVVDIDYIATLYNGNRAVGFDELDSLQCAGRFGKLCGQPMPDYSHRLTAGWSKNALSTQLVWRYIGGVADDDDANEFAVEGLDGKHYFDAELRYQYSERFELALGIQNLTDATPPVLGDNQEQANTYPATYDANGRSIFLRLTGKTGGGG